jgi:Flp pilus assembly secretin CpaC
MRFMMALALLISSLAFAGQPKNLAMPVGTTTTLSMSAPVSSVTVADPSLLEVTRQGRRVVFVGRSTGTTDVVVKTADGETRLHVYVAADKYGLPH